MEENEKKIIKSLRIFFAVSDAAFTCVEAISKAAGIEVKYSHMHELHKKAKEEIEKENPDLEKIDYLLKAMELEAEKKKK